MGSITDALLGRASAERIVLAIVAVHPSGITVTDIQEHEMWERAGGRSGEPGTRQVTRAIRRLRELGLICDARKKVRLTHDL